MFDILYLMPLMRIVFLFLISFCFLSFGDCNCVYAGTPHNKTHYLPAQNIEKTQQVNFAPSNLDYTIIKNVDLTDEQDYLNDLEDEDENLVSASRYILLARVFLTFSCTFILSFLYSSAKGRLPFCGHLSYISSYKYIIQRSLRI